MLLVISPLPFPPTARPFSVCGTQSRPIALRVFRLASHAALTAITRAAINVQIVTRKGMTTRAMGLLSPLRRQSIAAQSIHAVRHEFQMIRIHTGRIVTQMINFASARMPTREWANPQSIGKAMSTILPPIHDKHTVLAVATPSYTTSQPHPTPGGLWGNVSQEPFKRTSVHTIKLQEY